MEYTCMKLWERRLELEPKFGDSSAYKLHIITKSEYTMRRGPSSEIPIIQNMTPTNSFSLTKSSTYL